MKYEEIPLVNNEAIHNFELIVEGHRAFIDYKKKDDKIYLIHTEVPVELEGKGVASAIVEKAFNYIEENNLKLVPLCVYVASYLKRHPEWARILAIAPGH
ncbi:GNAT family N-acetyltransferase [Mucilaginibacter sp. cycad4]|jgi:predicted GNAT family acetyltransferase|uniref:GNAT family N-acetyltransferase n=1 Tax=Mucilaginibacter sp. cycad4 TaxID=3342096 RepID=UPI002AAB4E4C|nr:GNAT family N-acetyltransferase [Mucilaginibacter gossypii]WPU98585.1 GNAT family N-acetyltransferase [Mucilaginibacter gossypii]